MISRLLIILMMGLAGSWAQLDDYEQAPIFYSDTEPTDPLSGWHERLKEKSLAFDQTSEQAFLRDVLKELGVPLASQVLVYSKTSLQIGKITPKSPRALYFSEDYYVGWVQGGDIEIISVDPQLGPVFYLLRTPRPGSERPPRLERSYDCLGCHGSSRTEHVPGMLVRSVKTGSQGFPLLAAGTFLTEPSSPLSERWGGWYVTGENAGDRHMGNLIFSEDRGPDPRLVKDMGTDLKTLDALIDTKRYLTPHSDIVALMVMEHQIHVHNALTKAHLTTRRMLHRNRELSQYWNDGETGLSDTTKRVIENLADRLLDRMLFKDEFQLEGWGVEGHETFQTSFLADARRHSDGRSLKDFNLLSRLFKHRLSYMIYSKSFDHLPATFKEVFYRKLWEALREESESGSAAHLKEREKERILAILLETKDGLPDYWRGTSES